MVRTMNVSSVSKSNSGVISYRGPTTHNSPTGWGSQVSSAWSGLAKMAKPRLPPGQSSGSPVARKTA